MQKIFLLGLVFNTIAINNVQAAETPFDPLTASFASIVAKMPPANTTPQKESSPLATRSRSLSPSEQKHAQEVNNFTATFHCSPAEWVTNERRSPSPIVAESDEAHNRILMQRNAQDERRQIYAQAIHDTKWLEAHARHETNFEEFFAREALYNTDEARTFAIAKQAAKLQQKITRWEQSPDSQAAQHFGW